MLLPAGTTCSPLMKWPVTSSLKGARNDLAPGQVGFEVGHGVLASLCSHEERLSEK